MITGAEIKKNREERVIEFFKAAFCVDGDVHVVMDNEKKSFKIEAIVELNDSKRGTFYIAKLKRRRNHGNYNGNGC